MMTRALRSSALLALALILLACSDKKDPIAPIDPVKDASFRAEDKYGALKFTTSDGETTDWLAEGAKFTIDLAGDGTTTGRLFIPGMEEDGSDFDADLAGTWTLKGDTVRFTHEADTFVRDMPFLVRTNKLEGEHTFDGTKIQVTLVKK
jgi:hypothetical protein